MEKLTKHQRFLVSLATFFLVALFVFILFSEQGLVDLNLLKNQRNELVGKNEEVARENLLLSIEIDRLENDLKYIENIARRQLGMIAADEWILQPKPALNK